MFERAAERQKFRCTVKTEDPLNAVKNQEAKIGTDQVLRSVPFFVH